MELAWPPSIDFDRIELTTQVGCSVACTFCPQGVLQQAAPPRTSRLTTSNFARMLENLKDSSVSAIHFSGFSEPFLNFQTPTLIQMAVDAGFFVRVYTTGHGLNPTCIDRIADIPVTKFVVSIQPRSTNYRSGGRRTHPSIYRNIQYLIYHARSFRPQFSIVRFGSRSQIEALVTEIMGWCSDHYDVDDWRLLRESFRPILEGGGYPILSRAGQISGGKGPRIDVQKPSTPLRCKRGIANVLMPNGDLALCCSDYGLEAVVGNLLENHYNDVRNSDTTASVLEKMSGVVRDRAFICRRCEYAIPA